MSNALAAVIRPREVSRGQLQFGVSFWVMQASRRWRARFTERMRDVGQTDARWSALYWLADAPGGLIQSELAERIGIAGPSLVKLLDILEAQGLVSRRIAPGDRRANVVLMEPAGRQALAEMDRIAEALRAEVFAGLSDSELCAALHVLEKLAARLNAGGRRAH
jgi:MarR family transcriptional regulator for hemolysin